MYKIRENERPEGSTKSNKWDWTPLSKDNAINISFLFSYV